MSTTQIDPASPAKPEARLSFIDLLLVLAANARLLIIGPLVAGVIALGISFFMQPIYTATARILPPAPSQSGSAALAIQLGNIAGVLGPNVVKSPPDQYISLLKSNTALDDMIGRFKLRELYGAKYVDEARKALVGNTRITAGPKDGILSIEVDDSDPKRAAAIANGYIEQLRKVLNTLAITEAGQRRLFYGQQLKEAKENLAGAETALRASGVSEMLLKTMPQSALAGVAQLKAQITAQEIKLSSMRSFMTDSNPEVKLALNELVALKNELSKAEQANGKADGGGTDYVAKYREFK